MDKKFDPNETFYTVGGVVLLGGLAAAATTGVYGVFASLFCVYMMLVITNGFVRRDKKQKSRRI